MRAARPALGAEVLVVGAGDGGAVGLVGPVRAVLVAVAVVCRGDAQRVAAAELSDVAGGETWKELMNSFMTHAEHEVLGSRVGVN